MSDHDSLNDYLGPTRCDWVPEPSAMYGNRYIFTGASPMLHLNPEEAAKLEEARRTGQPTPTEPVRTCPNCHSPNTRLVHTSDYPGEEDKVALYCKDCRCIMAWPQEPSAPPKPEFHFAVPKITASTDTSPLIPRPVNPFAGMSGSPVFYDLLLEIATLHHRKQQDYTGGGDPFLNFKGSADFAGCTVAQAIRMHIGNKYERIKSLETQAKVERIAARIEANIKHEPEPDLEHWPLNEPTLDSYLDLAVYCLLYLAWMRSQPCES